jgi:hypothetical protein
MKYWIWSLGIAFLLMMILIGALDIAYYIISLMGWLLEKHPVIICSLYAFVLGGGTVFLRKHFFDDEDA